MCKAVRLPAPDPSRHHRLRKWKVQRRKPSHGAMQKAETRGRGATEFGPARERSTAKLPLPVAQQDVDQKSRHLKGKFRLYFSLESPDPGGGAMRGRDQVER